MFRSSFGGATVPSVGLGRLVMGVGRCGVMGFGRSRVEAMMPLHAPSTPDKRVRLGVDPSRCHGEVGGTQS